MMSNKRRNCTSQKRLSWFSFMTILVTILFFVCRSDDTIPSFGQDARIVWTQSFITSVNPNLAILTNKLTVGNHAKPDSSLAGLSSKYESSALLEQTQVYLRSGVSSQDITQANTSGSISNLKMVNELVGEAGRWNTNAHYRRNLFPSKRPIRSLATLAGQEGVSDNYQSAVPVGEFLHKNTLVTEGLSAMNGEAWQQAEFTGVGVKIGIIDLEFQGYLPLMGDELPTNIVVRNFVDGQTEADINTMGGPHGTGCAEIIHDIAPDAELYFAKINTVLDLDEAVDWFIAEQVDIISISTVWWNESPGDGTGALVDIVNKAYDANIFWAQAAGNERQRHWAGSFFDPDNNRIHNFTNENEVNVILSNDGSPAMISGGTTIRIFLRWDDWSLINQDYTLILARWNGFQWERAAVSENPQTGETDQTPTEGIIFTTSAPDSNYGIVIQQISSDRVVHFDLFMPAFGRLDDRFTTYTAANSIANLADAPNAVTVAAVRRPFPPYEQAVYSPEGLTNGPGGTAEGGFIKPDITAFAYVSTRSFGDGEFRFTGTSPAAPHVAGAAALVLDAYPSYTPMQIRSFLQERAIDMGDPGLDTVYGYGLLNLGEPPPLIINTPTATPFSTVTPTNTPLNTPVPIATSTSVATPVPTATSTSIATPTPTATRESTDLQFFVPLTFQ